MPNPSQREDRMGLLHAHPYNPTNTRSKVSFPLFALIPQHSACVCCLSSLSPRLVRGNMIWPPMVSRLSCPPSPVHSSLPLEHLSFCRFSAMCPHRFSIFSCIAPSPTSSFSWTRVGQFRMAYHVAARSCSFSLAGFLVCFTPLCPHETARMVFHMVARLYLPSSPESSTSRGPVQPPLLGFAPVKGTSCN